MASRLGSSSNSSRKRRATSKKKKKSKKKAATEAAPRAASRAAPRAGEHVHAHIDPQTPEGYYLERRAQLSDPARELLRVLVLVAEPISESSLLRLAQAAGLSDGEKPWTRARVRACAEELASCRLIVAHEEPSGGFLLPSTEAMWELMALGREERRPLLDNRLKTAVRRAYRWTPDTDFLGLRLAALEGDRDTVKKAHAWSFGFSAPVEEVLLDAWGLDPRESWLALLTEGDRERYIVLLASVGVSQLLPLGRDASGAIAALLAGDEPRDYSGGALLAAMREWPPPPPSEKVSAQQRAEASLVQAFFRGDYRAAVAAGEQAVARSRKRRHGRSLSGVYAVLLALSRVAIAADDPAQWGILEKRFAHVDEDVGLQSLFALAYFVARVRDGKPASATGLQTWMQHKSSHLMPDGWLGALTLGAVCAWLGIRDAGAVGKELALWHARASGCPPLMRELEATLKALAGQVPPKESLVARYRPTEPWKVALAALETAAQELLATPAPKKEAPKKYLCWEVSANPETQAVSIAARRMTARSKKGQSVSLTRMLEGKVPEMAAADRAVLSHVEHVRDYYYRSKKVPILPPKALLALVDHPNVRQVDGAPLRIRRGEPAIRAESLKSEGHKRRSGKKGKKGKSDDGGLRLRVVPEGLATRDVYFEQEDAEQLVVYERTPALEALCRAMGESVVLPEEAKEAAASLLGRLAAHVPVRSDSEVAIAAQEQEADGTLACVLHWTGDQLGVQLRVHPLGEEGPMFRPGQGPAEIVAVIEGTPRRARRDRDAEASALSALLGACPTLSELEEAAGERVADELPAALDVLLELDRQGDTIRLLWPHGQKLRVAQRDLPQAQVKVREQRDWLAVELGVPSDAGEVLGFRELLRRRRGRFVDLGEGRFLALTQELASRIDGLESLGKVQQKGAVMSPVLVSVVDDLLAGVGSLDLDTKSAARRDRVREALSAKVRPPRGFQAELRDYQREGFTWMARLAEAGLGACLADDMGLGKTVQTLALLQARAKRGPALVVAPTSVAGNWMDEARRFAPQLRPTRLRQASDRAAVLAELGPRDVLVCSYGILVSEAEGLSEVDWDCVVFDEAHLLKNSRAQRAKAAASLKASFRLSLSGTPIENHLGELWSLMNVTVPGLLGSERHFDARFGSPIQAGDRERAKQLRALLRPFLLRRTKAQVLDELPPRTETTLRVTPTAKEAAFYEALRAEAASALTESDNHGRLELLAQLTRLRQAAVDPRLVDAKAPAGAKLDALMERIEALREEGHRAIVFTQFLGAMARVQERLDEAGIEHLSLDGSTPTKEREKRIAAFQAGDGDVFVMSLKAGGVGVNLTGADYVLHLDPWWNPAVEEQATGRSHRIGQERPVTVYRFVTEGTIEEKILELHKKKRDLADDLLQNLDRAKKLDLSELRALI